MNHGRRAGGLPARGNFVADGARAAKPPGWGFLARRAEEFTVADLRAGDSSYTFEGTPGRSCRTAQKHLKRHGS
jgi:hypothetical protein